MSEMSILPVADPPAELPPIEGKSGKAPFGVRLANFIAVTLPFLALLSIWVWLWGWGFRWVDLGVLVGMYVFTALGITVGFHRLFTHRSFETYRPIQLIFGILGSMAVQGPLLKWVALHRRHHQHSDEALDPHSPHTSPPTAAGIISPATTHRGNRGEGWHNTHHAFPTSARHGLRWWQFDVSFYVIRLLALLRLAWNVKIPSKEAQVQGAR